MAGFAAIQGDGLNPGPSGPLAGPAPVPFFESVNRGFEDQRETRNTDARLNALLAERWKRNQEIEKVAGRKLAPSDFMLQLERQRDYLADRMGGTAPDLSPTAPSDDEYEAEVEKLRAANPAAFARIETREQLAARVGQNLTKIRGRADAAAESGLAGGAGAFVGRAAGAMTDLPNVVGLLYGGPGKNLAWTVLEQGLFNAGIEATQIPGRMRDASLAGPAYKPGEAVQDVLGAGVGAAALEGVGAGLRGAWRMFRPTGLEPAARGAANVLEQGLRDDDMLGDLAAADREDAMTALVRGAAPPKLEPDRDLADLFSPEAGGGPDVALYKGRPIYSQGFDPAQVATDAARFQYKEGGDASGVTARLKGVEAWDPLAAGRILVWEDRAGAQFVADGHQRHGLARRLNDERGFEERLDGYLFRERDGWSDADVRVVAALKNIREGSGSPMDAAKVFRERPEALTDRSLPITGDFVAQARGLAALSEPAFKATVNRVIDERYAAEIGRNAAGRPEMHEDMVALMKAADPANVDEARALVVEALQDDWIKREGSEQDLFGYDPSVSAMIGRAKIAATVKRSLSRDTRLFGQLVKNADAIEAGGNALARDANQARLAIDRAALEVSAKLALRHGPIGEAMARAAAAVVNGETPAKAAAPVLKALRTALEAGERLDDLRGATLDPKPPTAAQEALVKGFDTPGGEGARAQTVEAPEDVDLAEQHPGLFDDLNDLPEVKAAETADRAHQALLACIPGE